MNKGNTSEKKVLSSANASFSFLFYYEKLRAPLLVCLDFTGIKRDLTFSLLLITNSQIDQRDFFPPYYAAFEAPLFIYFS